MDNHEIVKAAIAWNDREGHQSWENCKPHWAENANREGLFRCGLTCGYVEGMKAARQQAPEPSREQQAFAFMRERHGVYAEPYIRIDNHVEQRGWIICDDNDGEFDMESWDRADGHVFTDPVDALLSYRDWLASKGEQ